MTQGASPGPVPVAGSPAQSDRATQPIRNFGWLVATQVASVIGAMLFLAISSRKLSLPEFTDFLVISSVAAFVYGILIGGAAFSLLRAGAETASHKRVFLAALTRRQLIGIFGTAFLVASFAALVRGGSAFLPGLLWAGNQAFTFWISAVNAHVGGQNRMAWSAASVTAYGLVANVALLAMGQNVGLVEVAAIGCGAQAFVTLALLAIMARRWKVPTERQHTVHFRDDLVWGTAAASGGTLARTRVDYLFLGQLTTAFSGAYIGALRVFDFIRFAPGLMINAVTPRLVKEGRTAHAGTVSRHLLVFAALGLSAGVVLRAIGVPLLRALFQLDDVALTQAIVWISLAIPMDFICWHGQWHLQLLRMPWKAAGAHALGLTAHVAIGLNALQPRPERFGAAILISLAVSALALQILISRQLTSFGAVWITAATGLLVLGLARVPVPYELATGNLLVASLATLSGLGALVYFFGSQVVSVRRV